MDSMALDIFGSYESTESCIKNYFPIEVLLLFEFHLQDWISIAERIVHSKLQTIPTQKGIMPIFVNGPQNGHIKKQSLYSRPWVPCCPLMCRFQCLIMLRALARRLSNQSVTLARANQKKQPNQKTFQMSANYHMTW